MTIKMYLESSLEVPLATLNMDTQNSSFLRKAYEEHLFRRQGLQLCKQLIQLAIEMQKHRGCTLAILSGDHFFETQLYGIQRDITDRLNTIEEFRRDFLSLDESMHIIQEWICIRRQWSNDTPEENFLLHSNLIAELLKLIRQIVRRAKLLTNSPERSAMVSFCFTAWLTMIETTAQARGLATHCAVKEQCPTEIRSRLKFLHGQLIDLDKQFNATLLEFSPASAKSIKHKADKMDYQTHLERFLGMLENDFCKQIPGTDADSVYTSGSHVVSACQQILVCMLKIIENKPSAELENWIAGKKPSQEANNDSGDSLNDAANEEEDSNTQFAIK